MRYTIDMAREAGLEEMWEFTTGFTKRLKAFEALVRADERELRSLRWDEYIAKAVEAEREACAKVCDNWPNGRDDVYSIGAAIRVRGETK